MSHFETHNTHINWGTGSLCSMLLLCMGSILGYVWLLILARSHVKGSPQPIPHVQVATPSVWWSSPWWVSPTWWVTSVAASPRRLAQATSEDSSTCLCVHLSFYLSLFFYMFLFSTFVFIYSRFVLSNLNVNLDIDVSIIYLSLLLSIHVLQCAHQCNCVSYFHMSSSVRWLLAG